jgi:hemolysin activation/secretion protein
VRNDLSLQLGQSSHAVYLGVDYGEVNGQSAANLIAKHLSGSALGLKGSVSSLSYDISVAAPINEPDGFSDDSYVVNATLNWGF